MIINCPICGGQLTLTPQHFGHNVNCPHCARVFQVPAASPHQAPQAPQHPLHPAQQHPAQPASPMGGPVPPHLQQGPTGHAQPAAPHMQQGQPQQAAPGHAQTVPDEEASEALASYREKRDKASTSMIIWVVVGAVAVPAVIGLVVLLIVMQQSSKESKQKKREEKETRSLAIDAAKSNLSVRNYTIENDKVKVSGGDKSPVVSGWATKDGETYAFECGFRMSEQSSGKSVLSVEYIEIDGAVIYP